MYRLRSRVAAHLAHGQGFGVGAVADRLVRTGPRGSRDLCNRPRRRVSSRCTSQWRPADLAWLGSRTQRLTTLQCSAPRRMLRDRPTLCRRSTQSSLGNVLLDDWSAHPCDIYYQYHSSAVRRECRLSRAGRSDPESPDFHRMGLDIADRPPPMARGPQGKVRGAFTRITVTNANAS